MRRQSTLERVPARSASLSAYTGIVDPSLLEEMRSLARPLRGLRMVHVNSTGAGGGVAERVTAFGLEADSVEAPCCSRFLREEHGP